MWMEKQKIRPELVDEILGGATTQEAIFGPEGVLKRMTAAIVERALGAELAHHLTQPQEGAANRRNGTSAKTIQSAHGPVALAIPRDRAGTFDPQLVPKHARRLAGFDDQVLALYARGMSTRDIQYFLADLYGTDVSPDLITRVTEAVWEELTAWQHRPLERVYAVLWLDALMVKMRAHGVVQNRAVYVAIGLRLDGRKEVLGLWVDGTEGAKFWLRVLGELRTRGVQDVLFCCCDGLKGFPQAIEAVFGQAIVPTCIVHQVRHSLAYVGWQERAKVAADLRAIYTAPSEAAAQVALDAFDRTWSTRYPAIVPSWRTNWTALTAFLAFPPEIRRMIYTTNAIESLNYQLHLMCDFQAVRSPSNCSGSRPS
jgi:putative transposase